MKDIARADIKPAFAVPKMSVIIPVYNSARYLSEALASVLMQKDIPEIEVVCIDDGSTDDSAEILEFWGKRDPRLHVIRQKNQGAGVARNVGLDVAKGEYIFFLDADDRLSSGTALRQAYEQAKADDLDVLLAAGSDMSVDGDVESRNIYLKKGLVPGERVFPPETLGVNLYLIVPMWPGAKLFRRSFLADRKLRFPALKRSEDFPMVQLALSLARRLGVVVQSLCDHRVGVATSLESTKDETPLIFAEAERLFASSLSAHGLAERFGAAAKVASVARMAYNLRQVCRFSSFAAIARHCAEALPRMAVKGDETDVASFAAAFKFVMDVVAAADYQDALVDAFADTLSARRVSAACQSRAKAVDAERAKSDARINELLRQRGGARRADCRAGKDLARDRGSCRRPVAVTKGAVEPDPMLESGKTETKRRMINPKVSIIVPVYNAAPYLLECLDSLVDQLDGNVEVICIYTVKHAIGKVFPWYGGERK